MNNIFDTMFDLTFGYYFQRYFYSIFEIKHCQLKSIPSFFGKFVTLERLNLEDNQIEKVPSSLGKLEKLLEIDLSRNELVSFPSEGFPMLEWLEKGSNFSSFSIF